MCVYACDDGIHLSILHTEKEITVEHEPSYHRYKWNIDAIQGPVINYREGGATKRHFKQEYSKMVFTIRKGTSSC